MNEDEADTTAAGATADEDHDMRLMSNKERLDIARIIVASVRTQEISEGKQMKKTFVSCKGKVPCSILRK